MTATNIENATDNLVQEASTDLTRSIAEYLARGPEGMTAVERRRAENDFVFLLPEAITIADTIAAAEKEPDPDPSEVLDGWEPSDDDGAASWAIQLSDFRVARFYGWQADRVGRVMLWLLIRELRHHPLFEDRPNRIDAAWSHGAMRLALFARGLDEAQAIERSARRIRRSLRAHHRATGRA